MPALTARRMAIGTAAGVPTLVWTDLVPLVLLRSVEDSGAGATVPVCAARCELGAMVLAVEDAVEWLGGTAAAWAPAAPPKLIAATIEIAVADFRNGFFILFAPLVVGIFPYRTRFTTESLHTNSLKSRVLYKNSPCVKVYATCLAVGYLQLCARQEWDRIAA